MIQFRKCERGHRFNQLRYRECPYCRLEDEEKRDAEEAESEALRRKQQQEIVSGVYAAPPAGNVTPMVPPEPKPVYAAPPFDKGPKERERLLRCVYAAPPFPKGKTVKIRRDPPVEDVYNGPDFFREEEVQENSGDQAGPEKEQKE